MVVCEYPPVDLDLLIVGSGIAGMTAALAAKASGLHVAVIEKTDRLGGSSAMSGGIMWLPNNPLLAEDGVADSAEWGRAYIDACVGDAGPASSNARREAFLTSGAEVVELMRQQGILLRRGSFPDYHPERPGGLREGRTIGGVPWDLHGMGTLESVMRERAMLPGVPLNVDDLGDIMMATRSFRGMARAGRLVGRLLAGRARRQNLGTMGSSLMGQLLTTAVRNNIPLSINLGLKELTTTDGTVDGAVLENAQGEQSRVRCGAVLLASGGFSHNRAMREKYQPQPASTNWTAANPGDTGEGILAGESVGGALDLMDATIWIGASVLTDGSIEMHEPDRHMPFGLIVDQTGSRFVNEAAPYVPFGQAIYRRQREVAAIPSWLIIDSRHRHRYPLGEVMPLALTPDAARKRGIVKADSLAELARTCKIGVDGLLGTVQRFNAMAAAGRDLDFGRGDSYFDRYLSDPTVRPNPNLGPVGRPPFYAVPIYPGDVGTTGGLLTDEHARVLTKDGAAVAGLYAAGNCTASVMGYPYPGPGASLGAAAVFGYRAATHVAKAKTQR